MQPLFTAYLAICLVAAFCLFKKKIWAQRFFFIQQLLRVVVGIDLLIGTIRMQRSTTYESSQYFWEQIGFGILFYAVLFLPSVLICWTLIKRTVRNEFNIKKTL